MLNRTKIHNKLYNTIRLFSCWGYFLNNSRPSHSGSGVVKEESPQPFSHPTHARSPGVGLFSSWLSNFRYFFHDVIHCWYVMASKALFNFTKTFITNSLINLSTCYKILDYTKTQVTCLRTNDGVNIRYGYQRKDILKTNVSTQ